MALNACRHPPADSRAISLYPLLRGVDRSPPGHYNKPGPRAALRGKLTSFTRSHITPFIFPPAVCAKVREPVAGMIARTVAARVYTRPSSCLLAPLSVNVQKPACRVTGCGTSGTPGLPGLCPAPALGIRDILISGAPDRTCCRRPNPIKLLIDPNQILIDPNIPKPT